MLTAALLATLTWALGLLVRALITAALLLATMLAALMLLAALATLVLSALIGIIRHDHVFLSKVIAQRQLVWYSTGSAKSLKLLCFVPRMPNFQAST